MLLKARTLNLISRSHPQRALNVNHLSHYFALFTTTIAGNTKQSDSPDPDSSESPDIPSWVTNQNPESQPSEDDDFVIPSLASWVGNHPKVKPFASATEKPQTQLDIFTQILKKPYSSPEEVVDTLNRSSLSVPSVSVNRLWKRFHDCWISAYGFFIWAKEQTGYKHDPQSYSFMVDILGKGRKFDLMFDLLEEMNQLKGYINLYTIVKVMRRLARAGRFSEAIEVFRRVEEYGVEKDIMALNGLLDALVKGDSVEHAHEAFLEFKECMTLNSSSFNTLIHGFCKARKLDDARKILKEMKEYGCQPCVVSYTCFIEAYCREKDFEKVDSVLDEMKKKGCTPNAVTYTIIMHARGKSGTIRKALEVYEMMKNDGRLPDSSFCSSLIFILSKGGRLKDADEIFEDMEKQGIKPTVLTYNTMISLACEHSLEEKALKLLQRMEEDSCKPNVFTYKPLLRMCCRKKRMKVLNVLLSHMLNNDVSIDLSTYCVLVHGLCSCGKLEQAVAYFEEMVLKGMIPLDSLRKKLVETLEKENMTEAVEKIQRLMSNVTAK
ncbi:hypothetical protein CCACVL1_27703 [Corchorus capsularis]|uniref:PROP1-like PPR domain-containing protein n=1 Tax=Corchorus capsularis TaxID=210143 RepID=A0A1R3G9A3_COCAP|nr:hypothetical protein CCACVL1_27703 [Corchorus capsularis]